MTPESPIFDTARGTAAYLEDWRNDAVVLYGGRHTFTSACVGPAPLIRGHFVDGEGGHFQVGLKVGFRLDDG